jgi:acyl carrier protein
MMVEWRGYGRGYRAVAGARQNNQGEPRSEQMADETARVLREDFVKQQVVEFIGTNFLYDGAMLDLGDDDSLIENGILDQTGIIELVLFLEDTYRFEVPETDLTPENFDTVANIADYVRQRMTPR